MSEFAARFYLSLIVVLLLVLGVLFVTSKAHAVDQRGIASWYWQPQKLSCGGRHAGRGEGRMGAASVKYPCGAQLLVCRDGTELCTNVTVMDHGPHVRGRVVDLFPAPARALQMTGRGLVPVVVTVVR